MNEGLALYLIIFVLPIIYMFVNTFSWALFSGDRIFDSKPEKIIFTIFAACAFVGPGLATAIAGSEFWSWFVLEGAVAMGALFGYMTYRMPESMKSMLLGIVGLMKNPKRRIERVLKRVKKIVGDREDCLMILSDAFRLASFIPHFLDMIKQYTKTILSLEASMKEMSLEVHGGLSDKRITRIRTKLSDLREERKKFRQHIRDIEIFAVGLHADFSGLDIDDSRIEEIKAECAALMGKVEKDVKIQKDGEAELRNLGQSSSNTCIGTQDKDKKALGARTATQAANH